MSHAVSTLEIEKRNFTKQVEWVKTFSSSCCMEIDSLEDLYVHDATKASCKMPLKCVNS